MGEIDISDIDTLPETNIAPENGWLEFGILISNFWDGLFSGAFAVSFRERIFDGSKSTWGEGIIFD